MKKISSDAFFFRKIFPVIWFGFIGTFFLIATITEFDEPGLKIVFMVGPIMMAAIGFFIMKSFVWGLVDAVYDDGDAFLIREGGKEDRIEFSNIMNVSPYTPTNPPRISLKLDKPCKFGQEIAFVPDLGFTLTPFGQIKAGKKFSDDLITRVDKARRKSRD